MEGQMRGAEELKLFTEAMQKTLNRPKNAAKGSLRVEAVAAVEQMNEEYAEVMDAAIELSKMEADDSERESEDELRHLRQIRDQCSHLCRECSDLAVVAMMLWLYADQTAFLSHMKAQEIRERRKQAAVPEKTRKRLEQLEKKAERVQSEYNAIAEEVGNPLLTLYKRESY